MLVRFAIFWRIVMHNAVDAFDVNTTGCDICGNKCHALTVLESLHGHVSAALTETSMQGFNC